MDKEKICRTCLETNIKMQPIFTIIEISKNNVSLVDILQKIYNYKVDPDDTMPKNICTNCVYQLTMTHSFKNLIDYSNESLLSVLHRDIPNYNTCDSDIDIKDEIFIEKTPKPSVHRFLYCAKCKGSFDSVKALQEHSQLHPVENILGRDCQYCNEKFNNYRNLVVHRKHHFSKHVCEKCWECFEDNNEYHNHVCKKKEEATKNPTKTVCQCDQCGKSYPPGYIKYHMMIHSEKRPYSCCYCSKKFKVRCSLNSHIKWRHERMRKHKCSVCSATFISSSSRSSHIRKHHLNERKYSCDSCSKCFFSKSCLDRHMLSHTGVKNFHCHMCSKSYQTRYGLNVHLRVHNHGQAPNLSLEK